MAFAESDGLTSNKTSLINELLDKNDNILDQNNDFDFEDFNLYDDVFQFEPDPSFILIDSFNYYLNTCGFFKIF
jgi:hypothetical protein